MRILPNLSSPYTGRGTIRKRLPLLSGAFMLSCLMSAPGPATTPGFPGAGPDYRAWVAASLPGNPEGLAVDSAGTIYAGLWKTGTIVRLGPHGGYQRIATVPSEELGKRGMTVGMELGPDGKLYVAYVWNYTEAEEADPLHPACRDSRDVYTGIYQVDTASGTVSPFLTKKDGWPVCFPDDIAFDSGGNLYVTDLTLSGIWKITPGRSHSLWSADALLQWPPPPFTGSPEGANDLELAPDGKSLYIVTDGSPAILNIPIREDGSAGQPIVVSRDLTLLDGIAVDERGNIYVSEPLRNEISVFSPDATQRIVVGSEDTAPISSPTSLIYHNGTLCVANSGMGIIPREPRNVICLSGFKRPNASRRNPLPRRDP